MTNIPFDQIDEDSFIEVPGSVPSVQVPLQLVGITNRPHYINVLDPFNGEPTRLFADMKLSLNLPADQRGLHMSRIERMMHNVELEDPLALVDYARELVRQILATQPQQRCRVEITADYELVVNKNKSGKPSHELMKLYVAADSIDGVIKIEKSITVKIMNACPCAQRWGIRAFSDSLKQQGFTAGQIAKIAESAPLQGHTQHGDATLQLNSDEADYKDLYKVLEKSSPIVHELLSGSDEGDFVGKTQQRGMFVEDVIREIMKFTVSDLGKSISDDTKLNIHVDVDESVHQHNLFSTVEDTFGNLKSQF